MKILVLNTEFHMGRFGLRHRVSTLEIWESIFFDKNSLNIVIWPQGEPLQSCRNQSTKMSKSYAIEISYNKKETPSRIIRVKRKMNFNRKRNSIPSKTLLTQKFIKRLILYLFELNHFSDIKIYKKDLFCTLNTLLSWFTFQVSIWDPFLT